MAQREAQVKRQELERETAVANMQAEVVRSEQMVRIAERTALAVAETAKGEAAAMREKADGESAAIRARAEGRAHAVRVGGEAEAVSLRAVGAAKAEAYRLGIQALGTSEYTAVQLAGLLGEHKVKLVPEIAVSGEGGATRLADVLVGRLLASMRPGTAGPQT